jgi:hypothetical protein
MTQVNGHSIFEVRVKIPDKKDQIHFSSRRNVIRWNKNGGTQAAFTLKVVYD